MPGTAEAVSVMAQAFRHRHLRKPITGNPLGRIDLRRNKVATWRYKLLLRRG